MVQYLVKVMTFAYRIKQIIITLQEQRYVYHIRMRNINMKIMHLGRDLVVIQTKSVILR
jgi:hypothetical protein